MHFYLMNLLVMLYIICKFGLNHHLRVKKIGLLRIKKSLEFYSIKHLYDCRKKIMILKRKRSIILKTLTRHFRM